MTEKGKHWGQATMNLTAHLMTSKASSTLLPGKFTSSGLVNGNGGPRRVTTMAGAGKFFVGGASGYLR